MKTHTIADAKRLSVDPATVAAVNTYLLAKARAEVWRDQVEPVQREMLKRIGAIYGPRYGKLEGTPIVDLTDSWLMSDEQHTEWCRLLEAEYRSRGWLSDSDDVGVCPLLKAEDLARKAARAMLEAASAIIDTFEPDGLICSGLENYRKGRDLVVGLIVNAPTYRRPSMPVAV